MTLRHSTRYDGLFQPERTPESRQGSPKDRKSVSPSSPAKPCLILFKGVPCRYDRDKKLLVIGGEPRTVFSSHASALKARWHTLRQINENGLTQPGGLPFHSNDYVLEDV